MLHKVRVKNCSNYFAMSKKYFECLQKTFSKKILTGIQNYMIKKFEQFSILQKFGVANFVEISIRGCGFNLKFSFLRPERGA